MISSTHLPDKGIVIHPFQLSLFFYCRYGGADVDCTTSISLDPTYVKAYSRRACARIGLGRLEDADRDFDKVLVLEPGNKFALAEKEKIQQVNTCFIHAVLKCIIFHDVN